MGKGIALMFKEAFPENFEVYQDACKRKEVRLGNMFAFQRDDLYGPKWIINFPTIGHWKYPSKLVWIEDGLRDLKQFIEREKIKSIAIPPLPVNESSSYSTNASLALRLRRWLRQRLWRPYPRTRMIAMRAGSVSPRSFSPATRVELNSADRALAAW
jgi:hypothetical protein